MTIPLESTWNASDILSNVTYCLLVSWFDSENQMFRTATGSGGYDFPINPGWGYFLYLLDDDQISVCGLPIINASISLQISWNMIVWYHDYNTTASNLMENISECIMISWYDNTNKTYRTATSSGGYDFMITKGLGLFVYTTDSSI